MIKSIASASVRQLPDYGATGEHEAQRPLQRSGNRVLNYMNKIILAAACSTSLFVVLANGQTSSPAPGTSGPANVTSSAEHHDASGTITDYTPESALVLQTGTSVGEPVHFRFAQKVTYVDTDGKTVEAPGLRKNLRVRVSYVKQGGDLVVDKVTLLE